MINPYASPIHEHEPPPAPAGRLFTIGHIVGASVLASPVAGALLVAINESRLGRASRAPWIVVGTAIVVGLIVTAASFSPHMPHLPFALGLTLGVAFLGKYIQGDDIAEHLHRGGQKASVGSAIGLSLLGLVVALAVIVGGIVAVEGTRAITTPEEVAVGPGQRVLYYDDTVSREQAQHLADGLRELDIWGGTPADVNLDASDGVLDLCFFVPDKLWEKPDEVDTWRRVAGDALPRIYPDRNVKAGLCNADGERKAEVFP